MRRRKLLSFKALTALESKTKIGIPLAAAMRQLDIDMSRPAVVKLLKEFLALDYHAEEVRYAILASLCPVWLDQDALTAQEQPDEWTYVGYFPTQGEWRLCKQ
jgi:hypothetical protein